MISIGLRIRRILRIIGFTAAVVIGVATGILGSHFRAGYFMNTYLIVTILLILRWLPMTLLRFPKGSGWILFGSTFVTVFVCWMLPLKPENLRVGPLKFENQNLEEICDELTRHLRRPPQQGIGVAYLPANFREATAPSLNFEIPFEMPALEAIQKLADETGTHIRRSRGFCLNCARTSSFLYGRWFICFLEEETEGDTVRAITAHAAGNPN